MVRGGFGLLAWPALGLILLGPWLGGAPLLVPAVRWSSPCLAGLGRDSRALGFVPCWSGSRFLPFPPLVFGSDTLEWWEDFTDL